MSNNLKKIIISNVTENNEFYDTNKDSFENNPNNDMVTDTANDMTNELSEKSMDDINKICFVDENKKQSNEMLEKNNEEQELYNIDNDSIDNDSTILTKELDIVDIDDIIDEEMDSMCDFADIDEFKPKQMNSASGVQFNDNY